MIHHFKHKMHRCQYKILTWIMGVAGVFAALTAGVDEVRIRPSVGRVGAP